MITLSHVLGLFGYGAIAVAMIVLGRLSQRLGSVTHARPYYLGLYVAAGLVMISIVVRLLFITRPDISLGAEEQNLVYTLLNVGLPAIAVTLALVVTWYYWSWLLAERD